MDLKKKNFSRNKLAHPVMGTIFLVSIMHSYFETLGKYLLFNKYLTSTNMLTTQQKRGNKLVPLKF